MIILQDQKKILKKKELNILMDIQKISIKFFKNKRKIHTIFHFAEFSRIYQSFYK